MKTIFSKLIIVMIFIIYTSNAQWKHLYNGLSDPIKSIYWIGLNSQNDSNIFCTLESYSLFESTDYGDTWKEINLPNVVENYGPIIASGSTIFIGSTGHGLYKSTDDGKNWQNIDLFSIRKPSNTKLTVHKINEFKIAGNNIYLSTDEGLFV